jgi:hypothetical protein
VDVKKNIFLVSFLFIGILFTGFLYAAAGEVEWYISNPAGMALERAMPLRALREKNALAVRYVPPEEVPREIRKYYSAPWRISCSVLYEDGKRVKTQWVFRDQTQTALFVAAISDNGAGFIEWYNDQGLLVEEQRLDADGSGYFISYSYRDNILLKAEGHLVEAVPQKEDDEAEALPEDIGELDELVPGIGAVEDLEELMPGIELSGDADGEDRAPLIESDMTETLARELLDGKPVKAPVETMVSASEMARNPEGPAAIPEFFVAITGREGGAVWTDSYRYTRSKSLRSIERTFHNQDRLPQLLHFPRFIPGGETDITFVDIPVQSSSIFLSDVTASTPPKIDYTFDNKRRIVTETFRGEDDAVIGELKNIWQNDHLTSVTWTEPGDERRVDYEYDDSGERIRENNYRNGLLERSLVRDGEREIETLYKDNKAVLRAVWVDGRKISEERLGRIR